MSKVKSMGFYEAEGVAAAESLPASQTLETFCIRAPVIFPPLLCKMSESVPWTPLRI